MKKKISFIVFLAVVFAVSFCLKIGFSQDKAETQISNAANAVLINREGKQIGTASLTESEKGVKLFVEINKLLPGVHSLHIHEKGVCQIPDFTSSGGHFNPYGTKHGFLNSQGPHAGDLPNMEVNQYGFGRKELVTSRVTLKKGKVNSLFKETGTALVIHQNPDDYITDPAGLGGDRIACGVIKKVD